MTNAVLMHYRHRRHYCRPALANELFQPVHGRFRPGNQGLTAQVALNVLGKVGSRLIAAAGVHPAVAQKIMRHSSVELTLGIYTHVYRGSESDAVNELPALSLDTTLDTTQCTPTSKNVQKRALGG